jgi:hypothetical protein
MDGERGWTLSNTSAKASASTLPKSILKVELPEAWLATPIGPPLAEYAKALDPSVVKKPGDESTIGPQFAVTRVPELLDCWLQVWPPGVPAPVSAWVYNKTEASAGIVHPTTLSMTPNGHFFQLLLTPYRARRAIAKSPFHVRQCTFAACQVQ